MTTTRGRRAPDHLAQALAWRLRRQLLGPVAEVDAVGVRRQDAPPGGVDTVVARVEALLRGQ